MRQTPIPRRDQLWTVGHLSRRSGIPIEAIREYTDDGLIYTRGRSPAGYRIYTSEALWCLELITTLRGLGLTIAEIRGLTRPHQQPPGPRLARLLAASRQRTAARIAALLATLARVDALNATHRAELSEQRPVWGAEAQPRRNSA